MWMLFADIFILRISILIVGYYSGLCFFIILDSKLVIHSDSKQVLGQLILLYWKKYNVQTNRKSKELLWTNYLKKPVAQSKPQVLIKETIVDSWSHKESFLLTFCNRVITNRIILWKINKIIDRDTLCRINTLFPLNKLHLPTLVCSQDAYLETQLTWEDCQIIWCIHY